MTTAAKVKRISRDDPDPMSSAIHGLHGMSSS